MDKLEIIPLPVDSLIPSLLASLEKSANAVITAQPGAGKTTRVPPALLSLPAIQEKEIWVLQPRRIAAKMAALRVCEELGVEPGGEVGYQFRFEKKIGPQTRLKFMTDGMLLPLAQADPTLSRVGAVVLDEFHERSLALELGLGFLRRLQQTLRPDLRIVVMSATLDSEGLSRHLSNCRVFHSVGRVFPVSVEYSPFPERPDLALKVRSALSQHLGKTRATTLVFLPGLAEIRRCQNALSSENFEVAALYGDLPVEEQQKVLQPGKGGKVILCTNVAETSLTVPGVGMVLDSGLTRQSRVSSWSGLPSLVTVPASQASAAQRAGRAGRLAEGLCVRLYSKYDFDHRAAFDIPELLRADLSKGLLDLARLGVENFTTFPWFQSPHPAALESALALLTRLGALDEHRRLTEKGKRMARLPLAPRLARFLLEIEAHGNPSLFKKAVRLACLISEEKSEGEDLLEELEKYRPGFESKRLEEQLMGLLIPKASADSTGKQSLDSKAQSLLSMALLTAFPDRIAKLRVSGGSESRNKSGKSRELVLSEGGTVLAQDGPLTRGHEYFLVVEAQETPQGMKARSLCPLEMDWLLDQVPEGLIEKKTLEWNSKTERVEGFKRLQYGQLVLDEKPLSTNDFEPEGAALLLREALASGPTSYCDPGELESFLGRVRFAASRTSKIKEISSVEIESTLRELCAVAKSFDDLRKGGFTALLRTKLSTEGQTLLEKLAPASVALPKGRKVAVHYESGKPPWAQSRVQDFFGMTQGPTVGGGEVPVVLHLLSPGQKPVQITSDLAGFWKNHYPQVRKEFLRRYPRHPWPENPA